ncbi:uncharacterized protein LOC121855009 [Homarus americanus]|uniref:Uncharacterized protein n=1 Tax=Homarus americanus TaxID=6706 RepID=A0A8J5N9V3_HOMAM|nr:uncharacterized protein LOC121855009 [Homarus americanus]KAG7175736.1 hypothetical protein Hamer_G009738 [Homarus americanus]
MAGTWQYLLVAIISCGLCFLVSADDSQEPGVGSIGGSSAEGTRDPKETIVPSLDSPTQTPIMQSPAMFKSLDFESIITELPNRFDKILQFSKVMDKDTVLETDLADESRARWIKYVLQHLPIIPTKKVVPQNIEHPMKDAPRAMWNQLLETILKGYNIISVDDNVTHPEKQEDNDVHTFYTAVNIDPFGQFFSVATKFIKSISNYDSVHTWWNKFRDIYQYSAFSEGTTLDSEKKDIGRLNLGIFQFPLAFGQNDLLKLALNFLTFLGIQSLFWSAYAPTPFTVLEDEYDYNYDDGDNGEGTADGGDDYDYNENDFGDTQGFDGFNQDDNEDPNQGFGQGTNQFGGETQRRRQSEWPHPSYLPQVVSIAHGLKYRQKPLSRN